MSVESVVYFLLGAAVSALLTYFLTKSSVEKNILKSAELDYQSKKNGMVDEITSSVLGGEQFQQKIENARLKGIEEGRTDELKKFSVVYEPYEEVAEEYLGMKKRVELGYDVQFTYAGWPIGQSSRKAMKTNIEFDREAVDRIFNSEVMGFLNNVTQLAATKGMSATVGQKKISKKS